MRTGNGIKGILVTFTASALLVILAPWAPGEAKDRWQIRSVDTPEQPIVLGAQQAGDTTCIYWEDFQQGDGGWVGVDLYAQKDTFWHRTTYDNGDGHGPRGVMWCGADDSTWATPPGYGNNWVQDLSKSFTLPGISQKVTFELHYDTEQDYDFLYFDVSEDGGENFVTIVDWDGSHNEFFIDSLDLTPYGAQTVILRFRFESDAIWSDEDGLCPTNGAARLDWVQVTGHAVDDFESDDDGWVASAPLPTHAPYRLEETPACEVDLPCDDYCFSWVAYDSVTGLFPFEYESDPVYLMVESPAIDIPTDATAYLLQFDVYLNLPRENLVYYAWQVAAPPVEQGGSWDSDQTLYYGAAAFYTRTIDVTPYMTPGATQMKIRLRGVDMYDEWHASEGWSGEHTSAPMFDNVAIYAVDTEDPGIDDSEFPRPCGEDTDGDGVIDSRDSCATEDASRFDSDGDGCIDEGAGGRHVEYWDRSEFPVTYLINESGAPGITDSSDFIAIEYGIDAWTVGVWVPGDLEASVDYGGPTSQRDARALDQVNLVTFDDPDYRFGAGVIAVCLTTSFTEATYFGNRWCRPGQLVDADIIFNPGMSFRTTTQGPEGSPYVEAVTTHEAGHLFGLSHSAVTTSTMYFVLGQGLDGASLEMEDEFAMYKAYALPEFMESASRLTGTVTDGYTGEPLPGAAVFAIDAATGDTLGCEYTLPTDGTYTFIGLPDGDYYVAIHPLNGSSAIGYTLPAYINDLIASTAVTVFVPESWDSSESAYDDPVERDAVPVSAAGPDAVANIITNIDETGPVVISVVPDSNETDVSIDGSVLIQFSEPINSGTVQGNFSLTDTTTQQGVAGNAAILKDDSLIAFVPLAGLCFSATYELRLDTGLEDMFGNGLAEPYVTYFSTEAEPDVALYSLSPSKGVIGMIISLNGKGFDPEPGNNTVSFNGTPAVISEASPTQIITTVPDGASSGAVNVYNHTQDKTSNDLQFTILEADEVPKGFRSEICDLSGRPHDLTVLPAGDYVFVATDAGAEAVITDPASEDYMTATTLSIAGGLTNIDAGPAGNRVYGVSKTAQKLYRMSSVPGSMQLLSAQAIGAEPRGILIHPKGHRAFIPTDEGEIQMWDLDESSPSFETQIGHIAPVDPNIEGELATDPVGDLLMALTATGKMLVADVDSSEVTDTISVGVYPEDVAVDPVGNMAYVCDETGLVSIVSLTQCATVWTIRTGGALKGISVTPAGTFAIVVDRELNLLSAIDLRDASPSYLGVVATVELPVNPVDLELSPDGDYAFTISEAEEVLVATALGVGPSLATLSRIAGPVGTRLVLAGSGFRADSTFVAFENKTAAPDRLTDSCLTVIAPGGISSGEVSVVTVDDFGQQLESNGIYFEKLTATQEDMLRLAASLPGTPLPAADGGSVMQVSPGGDYIALADSSGGFHILVSDANSAQYHRYAGSLDLGSVAGDIVIPPDGQRAFVILRDVAQVRVIGSNRLRSDFLSVLATVDFSGIAGSSIAKAAASPDGSLLLVSDPGVAEVHFVDITPGSATQYEITASVSLASGPINGIVREMAFHPGCEYAYLPVHDASPAVILILDTAPESPTYQTVVSTFALPGTVPQEMPISLSFTPSGYYPECLVLTSQWVSSPHRSVVLLDAYNPMSPALMASLSLGGPAAPVAEHIHASPRGDRAIANVRGMGLLNIEILDNPDSLAVIQQAGKPSHHLTTVDHGYAPDASKFYCLSASRDTLSVYDFSEAQTIAIYSGDGQSGVVGEPLAQPLRAQVSGPGGTSAGVPVDFTVTSGGGHFPAPDSTVQVVATDENGIAQVSWTLGPDVGVGSQTVQVTATGLSGSPLVFTADGLVDPTTQPLTVLSVAPDSGTTDISIATATQTTFSRPVDATTVNDTTFFLHDGDFVPVPAVIGFADGKRKVSLSPQEALETDATYWIEMTVGILDEAGGPLDRAVASSFATEPPLPIELGSVKPASGPVGAVVVLSGGGFDKHPSYNTVLFDTLEAHVTSGGTDFLSVFVPTGAASGCVRVVNTVSDDTSGTVDFIVLPSDGSPLENAAGSVPTVSATRSVSITPDGMRAYAVSPDADKVSVIDLGNLVYVTSIAVGDNPVAVTIDPKGDFAYVANYLDGTVSVIDVYIESPSYNQVVDVFSVGVGPTDVAITPDGDRLIVANLASGEISVIDTDPSSVTYRSVVSTVMTGVGSRTVAITPDGALIYVGTDTGYLVISAVSYGVVSTVMTGVGSRTVAITPDGALLVLLATDGVVYIYDIQEGSVTENQVVARVQTTSGTTSVAISPDGAFLYMIEEVGDIIIVGVISITKGYGVVGDGVELPLWQVNVTFVDTLVAGEDPAALAFDLSGIGQLVVANAGDRTVTVFRGPGGGAKVPVERPQSIRTFPNPFNQSTTVQFAIPKAVHVRLAVYDVRGRLVATMLDEARQPGIHRLVWNGTDRRGQRVASGVYFCRLEAGEFVKTRKMIMLR